MAPTTPVLAHAQAKYRERFRSVYGCRRSPAAPPCRPSSMKSSAARTDSHVVQEGTTKWLATGCRGDK